METNLTRRKALGGIAAAGTLAIGGVGLVAQSGGARATGGGDYEEVTVTSDDGTVEYVAIYGASTVEWDGFEEPAQTFDIVIEAKLASWSNWRTLNETGEVDLDNDNWGGADESLSGSGTSGTIETGIGLRSNGNHNPETDWHIVGTDPDGYGLPQNSLDPAELEVDEDGATETFEVQVRSTYTWYDTDGDVEFTESFESTVPVEVNNELSTATASGSNGGATGE